jgi:hypothetical protein
VRVNGAAAEKVVLEVELDVCVLLDDLEDLDCLVDDLAGAGELFAYLLACYIVAMRSFYLPRVRHRRLRRCHQ